MADGKAHFSLSGVGGDCSYTQTGDSIALTCEGETSQLTLGADGALSGPPDSFMTRMTRAKD